MSNPNFKQDFEQSLQRLSQINTAIDANLKGKQEFSARIIQRLSSINDKVKQLGDSIRVLKEQLTKLQAEAATNNNHIEDNVTEVNGLKQQITQLTEQRDKALAELVQLKKQGLVAEYNYTVKNVYETTHRYYYATDYGHKAILAFRP